MTLLFLSGFNFCAQVMAGSFLPVVLLIPLFLLARCAQCIPAFDGLLFSILKFFMFCDLTFLLLQSLLMLTVLVNIRYNVTGNEA